MHPFNFILTFTFLFCVFTAQMTTMNTDTVGNHMIHMVSYSYLNSISF